MSGRGRKVKPEKVEKVEKAEKVEKTELLQTEEEPAVRIERPLVEHKRIKPPSIEELYKVIRSTSNKIEILIDNLEETEDPTILKRNVAVALKHLKAIQTQLTRYAD